ncbi:electron transfer flavoprotein subunit alpha [Sulfolobales archaeon HS-7]|nr:electron transfer flavoprotein subunit alpha [Sulfolobales archaeon HS-7]
MTLNILVAFKIVPDETLIKISGDKVDLNVPVKISTYDKNAIEEGLELREKYGGKVIGISVGVNDRKTIREALAMGLDEVISITPKTYADALATAKLISEEAKGYDLLIFGESSTDGGDSAVGPMVGEILGYPVITYVRRVEIQDGFLVAERNLTPEVEEVKAKLPCVISVTGEANTPRIPTLKQIMESGKKKVVAKEVEIASSSRLVNLTPYFVPRKKVIIEGKLEEQVQKVVEILRGNL